MNNPKKIERKRAIHVVNLAIWLVYLKYIQSCNLIKFDNLQKFSFLMKSRECRSDSNSGECYKVIFYFIRLLVSLDFN